MVQKETKPTEASVWLRLGVTLSGNKEDIEKIIQGEGSVLDRFLAENRFSIDGESYIPVSVIEEYNKENGTDFDFPSHNI